MLSCVWRRMGRAAAAVLVLLAFLSGAASPAQAQTPETVTLVSNIGQGSTSSSSLGANAAQRFTTGGNATGYVLTGIDIVSGEIQGGGRSFSVSVCEVDNSGFPDSSTCTALTAPGSFLTGTLAFTAASGIQLSNNTTYTILLETTSFTFGSTSSDTEDSGAADEWSLHDGYDYTLTSLPGRWFTEALALRVAIKGYANNNAPTVANEIPDQTAGARFLYTFPENTFADDDTLTYEATLSNDDPLPSWLGFDAGTRTFSGTPEAGDAGTLTIRVTATDGFGESVHDEFDIAVNPGATACAAPDFGDRERIWTGTVTVGSDTPANSYGFVSDVDAGDLDDTDFDIGGRSYAVDGVWVPTSGPTDGNLFFSLVSDLTAAEVAALKLHVCDTGYDFSDATHNSTFNSYQWSLDLDWSGETMRTLYLSLPANNPATGTPTISSSGDANEGDVLTVATDGIEDTDGLPDTFVYVWYREDDDGSNRAAISSATSSAYTLAAEDVGKRVRVRVAFDDDLGRAEERDSAPWPDTGTVSASPTMSLGPTLVGNDSGTETYFNFDGSRYFAQSFDAAERFTLNSLELYFAQLPLPPRRVPVFQVTLHRESTNRPGEKVADLTSPATVSTGGANVFEAPPDTVLDAGTYYVQVYREIGKPDEIRLAAGSDAESGDSLAGWTISNGSLGGTNGTSWTGYTIPFRMVLRGSAAALPDATLSGLTLVDTGINSNIALRPDFDPETTEYTANARRVARVTLSPATADEEATVAYEDGEGNPLADADGDPASGHQVDLEVGENVIRIVVTAGDGMTTKEYTVTATREPDTAVSGVAVTSSAPRYREAGGPNPRDVYGAGDVIEISVTFSAPVNVDTAGGVPALVFSVSDSGPGSDRNAVYVRGTGAGTLVFAYTVQPADSDANGIFLLKDSDVAGGALQLNGGSISAVAGGVVSTAIATRGVRRKHKVDGSRSGPYVDSLEVTSTPRILRAGQADPDTYGAGETIEFTLTLSEAVTVTGAPHLQFDLGGAGRNAGYTRGSGSDEVVFAYTVQAADSDSDGILVQDGEDVSGADSAVVLGSGESIAAVNDFADADLVNPGRGTRSGHRVDGSMSVFDTTAPTVLSVARHDPSESPTNADALTWRVTFSEDVRNVDPADFTVTGSTATVTGVQAVSGETGAHDVTVSGGDLADFNGTVTLGFAATQDIEDLAGNRLANTTPTGAGENGYELDNTAPTVDITEVPDTSEGPFRATFAFSEAVTGFALGDIAVGNGTLSEFTETTTGTVWTVLVTPTAYGVVTLEIPADAATDAAGNGNTAAEQASSSYVAPNAAPTVANPIDDQTAMVGEAFSFTVPEGTFDDADTGDTLTYMATLDDESALPDWLTFTTDTFSGTPGAGDAGTLTVRVTASDGEDTVHEDFRIKVGSACPAPDFGDRERIWSGTVTVVEGRFLNFYASHGYLGPGMGALSDVDFGIGANTYTVDAVAVADVSIPTLASRGGLVFSLTSRLSPTQTEALRLHVCDTTYDFSDATSDTTTRSYVWSAGFDWSSESERTVYLSLRANTPATGTPMITGSGDGATVGDVLTAGRGDIDDAEDGLSAAFPDDYALQWVRQDEDGMNPVDITGETSETYRLTDDDVGKKVWVRVTFIDDLGRMETRESAPFPTAGTVTGADTAAPRVASIERRAPADSPTNADSLTWRVRFSEDVRNVDQGDFTVTGTTATLAAAAVSGSDPVYDVTASGGNLASLDGTVTLTLATDQDITDTAGNALTDTAPTGTDERSWVVDNTAPTVTITDVPATSDAPFPATFTFSEPVTGFAAADITVGNGTASAFTNTTTGTEWTALITPAADGAVTVDVAADVADDEAGNGNLAAAQASSAYAAPNTPPTARAGMVTTGEDTPYPFTAGDFEFTDTDAGDTLASVRITALETAGDLELDGADVTLDQIVPKADIDGGRLVFTPAANANGAAYATFMFRVSDGDDESASAYTMTIDVDAANDAPTVANEIADQSATVDEAFSFTVPVGTFEDIDGDPLQYSATQGDDSGLPAWLTFDAGTRTFAGTPGDGDTGTLAVKVTAEDGDGETASDQFDIVVSRPPDTTAPTVLSIERHAPVDSPTNADTLTWRVTFSEDVANVDQSDFTVTGTTATLVVTEVTASTVYDVTASGVNLAGFSGTVTLGFAGTRDITDTAVPPNALTDTAPTDTDDRSWVVDNTPPTVTIMAPSATNAPFTATFTFSESVTGFALGDITVGNGTASNFTSGDGATTYTATITPSGEGEVTLDVAANAAEDAAGNGNEAAEQVSVTHDMTRPTVTITAPDAANAPFPATFTFSGPVTGFVLADITVGNGTASDFTDTDGGTTYTATITPSVEGEVTLDVAADVAEDTASNGNLAATRQTVDYDATAPTVESIVRHAPAASPTNADSLTWRVTFSEDMQNVDAADFSVDGSTATVTGVQAVSGETGVHDVTVSGGNLAGFSGTVTLGFAGTQDIADEAGNALAATVPTVTDERGWMVDNTAPTVAVMDVPATTDAPFPATFEFSEPVTGFTLEDIAVGNGAASAFTNTTTRTEWTALITPAADGEVTVDVAADVADDEAGNGNLAAVQARSTYTAPNNPPTAQDSEVTIEEDTPYPFTAGDFEFTDTDAGDTLASVRITALETAGDLELDGADVPLDQVIPKADIDAGKLVFTPAANANGTGYATFRFRVNDGTDGSDAEYTMTVDVNAVNDAPAVANPIPNQSATVDAAFSFTVPVGTFEDIDGDPLQYSATQGDDSGLPAWLTFNTTTRTFTGTPGDGDTGTLAVKVTAEDGDGETASDQFDIVVHAAPNAAPAFDAVALTRSVAENAEPGTNVGDPVPAATDGDGDALTYAMEGDDGASFDFDATARQIATKAGVDYDFEAKATYSVTVKADDGEGGTATVAVTITLTDVAEPPDAPAQPSVTATPGSTTSLDVSWVAPANTGKPDIASYDLRYCAGQPADCTTDGDFADGPQDVTGTSAAIPGLAEGTAYQVQVRARNDEGDGGWSDSGGGTTATPVDAAAPTVESIVRQAPAVSPTNADTLTWRVTFSEDVANVDPSDFAVTGTTATLAVTEVTASTVHDVTASGGNLASLDGTVTLGFASGQDIADTADPPNALTAIAPTGTDERSWVVDNTAPTVTIEDVPATSDGPFRATFTFSEGVTGFALSDISVVNGTASDFTGSNGDTEYTALITPAASGEVTVNVVADAATDAVGNLSTAGTPATSAYSSNAPPTADDRTVITPEDTAYAFRLTDFNFADTDTGDTLDSVRVVTLPPADRGELRLDGVAVTEGQAVAQNAIGLGLLAYTPPADANGDAFASFTFRVSDGTDESVAAYTMTIEVTPVSDAPALANPIANQQATLGVPFRFTIPADAFEDADGDLLDYEATRTDDNPLPAWLSFTDTTRTLEGTPGPGDAGTLTVKVSVAAADGEASGTFDIVVASAGTACPAPNLGTRRRIWTGNVTVGSFDISGIFHYGLGIGAGALDDATFAIGTSAYGILRLSVQSGGANDGDLFFRLRGTERLTEVEKGALRLHVCDAPYDFGAAIVNAANNRFNWTAGLDWSGETARTLYLSLPANRAATGAPTITSTGAATSGDTLTATAPGGIADEDGLPDAFTYQWIREDADGSNPAPIAGETAATYTLTNADVGKRVRVRVGFTDRLGSAETRESGPWPSNGVVAENPANGERPVSGRSAIAGTARLGETLTADTGAIDEADGVPPSSFRYQWIREEADGTNRRDIPGANGSSYTPVPEDAGKMLYVRVTFTDAGGGTVTVTMGLGEPVSSRPSGPGNMAEGRAVTLEFGQPLDPGSVPAPEDFEVRFTHVGDADREVTRAASIEDVGVAGSTVTLTLYNPLHHRDAPRVSYTPGSAPLRYAGGVEVPGFGDAALENRTPDTEPPRVRRSERSTVDGATLRITFSEPLDPGSVPAPEGFRVTFLTSIGSASWTYEPVRVERVSVSGRVVTLTLDRAVDSEKGVSLTYSFEGGVPIRDLAGNPTWVGGRFSADNRTVTGSAAGKTLTADGNTVTVVFDEALDAGSAPPPGDFRVKRGPMGRTPVETVAVSGSTVRLTVDPAIYHDAEVRLSYVPGASPLRFGDGRAVAGFGNQPVENRTGAPAPVVWPGAEDVSGAEGPEEPAGGEEPESAEPSGPPLTATLEAAKDEHGGDPSVRESVSLRFSEAPAGLGSTELGALVSVTGGTLDGVEGAGAEFTVRFRPAGVGPVTVRLPAGGACGTPGSICTPGGRALSAPAEVSIQGPIVVSVADAEVQEAPGATLDFVVSLSRPVPAGRRLLLVGFRTQDGTAVQGEDYRSLQGRTYIRPGETSTTISIGVVDDAHDEGTETMTLTISDPSSARIGDGTATGTIINDDPMPRAWAARFGRTVAEQVLEAMEGRMRASRTPGAELTLAGQRIGIGGAGDDEGGRPSAPRDPGPGPLAGSVAESGFGTGSDAESEADRKNDERWLAEWLEEEADAEDRVSWRRGVSGRDLLLGSSFALTEAAHRGPGGKMSLWGRSAVSRFDGREGDLALDGEVVSSLLGGDWALGSGDATAGLIVGHSRGEGGYRGGSGDGTVRSTLTGLYPWGRGALSDRLEVWGAAGYGEGTLTLTPDGPDGGSRAAMRADLDLAMVAAGLRGMVLAPPPGGGPELAVTADATGVRTTTARVRGLAPAEADVTRLRLGLKGTWAVRFGNGGMLTPSLAVGARHDGGDAETGYGADVGGGVAWSDPVRGLSAELRARGLLSHEAKGFRERGLSGALSWEPGAGGRGPRLSLTRTVGGASAGGVDALLGRRTLAGLAADDGGDGLHSRRLEARFGYGFGALGDGFTLTPEAGVGVSDTGRDYALGWRLVRRSAAGDTGSLEFAVEARRRESASDNGPPHDEVGLRVNARW